MSEAILSVSLGEAAITRMIATSSNSVTISTSYSFINIPQFGITECLIQYKCSVNTPPPHSIRSG